MIVCLTAACADDYVHIVIEGSSPDLSSGPVTVELAVFGGERGVEHPFAARLVSNVPGSADGQKATDFNLVLDRDLDSVDIRVAIPTPTTRWSAGVVLEPPFDGETQRLVLQPGDHSLGTARLGAGEPGAVARYRGGLATAWSSTEGVSLRIDGNPDSPLARADTLSTDRAAIHVRVASPPTEVTAPGPDRLAVAWVEADGIARLLYVNDGDKSDVFPLGEATEVALTCPADGSAAAVLTRSEARAVLSFRGPDGAELSSVLVASDVRALRGVLSAGPSTIIGMRGDRGSSLVRVTDGAVARSSSVEELLAMSLSSTGERVLTVQRRGQDSIVLQAYGAAELEPIGDAVVIFAGRTPVGIFAGLDIAPCGVTWPQARADGTGSVDLWFQDIDAAGVPTGTARILPGSWRGSHLAPRAICPTSDAAYAIFAVATDLAARDGTLALRRIPEAAP